MKGSEEFKKAIQSHLDKVAEEDALFSKTLAKPNKNIDDCITYILNEVKASGQNGFAESEIYAMAVHYYDEDDIKPGTRPTVDIVVSTPSEGKPATESSPTPPKTSKPAQKKATKVDESQISLF